jgi:hypothetical protein
VLIVVLVLGVTPLADAQTPPVPAKSRTAAKPRAGGPQEGIKVHGHWSITVRNEDGSVASRTEFDNSLQFAGKNLLTNILKQNSKPGRWTVILDNLSGTKACASGTFVAFPPDVCYVTESDSLPATFTGTNVSRNLSVTLVPDANNVSSLVLSGSVKALQQGGIDRVGTTLGGCDISVAVCHVAEPIWSSSLGFSFAFVSVPVQGGTGPIPVQQGQTIDVTVKFSFS